MVTPTDAVNKQPTNLSHYKSDVSFWIAKYAFCTHLAHTSLTKMTSTVHESVICWTTSRDRQQQMVDSYFTNANLTKKRYSEVCNNLQFVLDHSAAYVPDLRHKSNCLSASHTKSHH